MKHILAILIITSLQAGAQSPAFGIADSLYAVKNYREAIKSYQSIKGYDAQVTLQLARAYQGLGLKSKALQYYQKSLFTNPEQPIALTEYGQLLITTRNFNKADSLFASLVLKYPNNAGYYYQWGRALKEMEKRVRDTTGRTEQNKVLWSSQEIFAKAIELDSNHQKALYELALYHLKERNYPEVEKLTQQGLENDSLDIEMINLSAQNVYNKGDFSKAIDRFEKLVSLGVENEFIHKKLGTSYYKQRYYELSRDHFEKVITYDDQDASTHLTLARLNNYLKDFEKAIYHSKVALQLQDQPLDEIYYTLGRTYELHKKYPQAIAAFKKVIQENPESLRAYRGIAICADNYYEDKQEVLKLYKDALEKANGSDAGTSYLRSLLEERIKELQEELFMTDSKGK